MAPNKKKKKTSVNPARGFATISIASKPKSNDTALAAVVEASTTPLTRTETDTDFVKDTGAVTSPKELHELSPEEFEKRLEESELQTLVEQHALKTKRESARQVTRLQTERRLLRGQAEHLNLRHWLTPEVIEEITELIRRGDGAGGSRLDPDYPPKVATANEEESSVRLWMLQQTLQRLGIPEDRVQQVIQSLTDRTGTYALSLKGAGKDMVCGLEESLDWLALSCDQEDLPSYEDRRPGQRPKQPHERESLGTRQEAGETEILARETRNRRGACIQVCREPSMTYIV